MNRSYLFPARFKKVGMILFLLSLTTWIVVAIFGINTAIFEVRVYALFGNNGFLEEQSYSPKWIINEIYDELMSIVAIIGGLLWSFSKEPIEDEFISELRKSSLVWAVYVFYGTYILATILIYGSDFLTVLCYNTVILLSFFILRFEWLKYKHKNSNDEE